MTFRFKPLMLLGVCWLSAVSIQAHAQDTNAKFLQFSLSQRDWWYMGAFDALGHTVMLRNKTQGNCVYNWYFQNPESRKTLIETTMRKYPEHAPTAILIALLRKDCGDF
jgi:hypothetical protein